MSHQFYNVCRICLQQNIVTYQVISPINSSCPQVTIESAISEYACVQFGQDDGLPQTVCFSCKQELYRIVRFRKLCEKSEKELRTNWRCNVEDTPVEDNSRSSFEDEMYIDEDEGNEKSVESDRQNSPIDLSPHSNLPLQCIITETPKDTDPFRQIFMQTRCDICGKNCYSWHSLQVHRVSHIDIKPYICETCGKGFTMRSNLSTHRKIHYEDKRFSCVTCGKSFVQKKALSEHMMKHTDERPYKCEECDVYYKNLSSLLRHRKTHGRDAHVTCDLCGKSFGREFALRRHWKSHTAPLHSMNSRNEQK